MQPMLNAVVLYARSPERTAVFYATHFGYQAEDAMIDGVIALASPGGCGATLLVLQAAKSVKLGHAGIKLVFTVSDVEAFKAEAAGRGLVFGPTHQADGYQFANVKDPDGNSVSVSSRLFSERAGRTG